MSHGKQVLRRLALLRRRPFSSIPPDKCRYVARLHNRQFSSLVEPCSGGLREQPVRPRQVNIGGTIWTTGENGLESLPVEAQWQHDKEQSKTVIELHSAPNAATGFEGFGVIKEDKEEDLKALVESFTSPALAAALRDRETTLQICAHLLELGDTDSLRRHLRPFSLARIQGKRKKEQFGDLSAGLKPEHLEVLRKYLSRMPRHITKDTDHRASVMIVLCNVAGVPSVLFTKRSSKLRTHKDEVCFPGGKVDVGIDHNIQRTALREVAEEIGLKGTIDVLGILRCDWSEVASIVGVAVTPVVGFAGNLTKEQLRPNPDEVSHCFTIPLRQLLDREKWIIQKFKAPVFVGGPYPVWGLTGYLLDRFVRDVLEKHGLVA